MDSIILRGLLEFFIRERVLIIGTKESGKSKLVEKLMDLQYFDVEKIKSLVEFTDLTQDICDLTQDISEFSISSTSSSLSSNSRGSIQSFLSVAQTSTSSLSSLDSKAATVSKSPPSSLASLKTNSRKQSMNLHRNHHAIGRKKSKMNHLSEFFNWLESSPIKTTTNSNDAVISSSSSSSKSLLNDLPVLITGRESMVRLLSNQASRMFSEYYYYLNYCKDANIVMRIWDTYHEHWHIFLNEKYHRPQTILVVYNSNNLNELKQIREPIENYLSKLTSTQRQLVSIYIVGSKIDLGHTQPLTYELRRWIDKNQMRHMYVSSEWNKGVNLLRSCLLEDIYNKHCTHGLLIHRNHLLDLYISTIGYCPTIVYDSCIAFENNNQTEQYHSDEQSKNCHLCQTGSRPLRPIDFNKLKKDPKSMLEFHMALENICQCLYHLMFTVGSSSSLSNTTIPYPLLTIVKEQNRRKRNLIGDLQSSQKMKRN
ncbi:hypothetical protein DERP_005033 [Dermatophagoides pteronyssinus]|uniref:Uncharacterized protein LOC113789811 n=2 Tax=Dermatophagoides pteronyssinus TaxID=6956 RepID=A0A6P6XQY0_DERPT|nr:uncharacterized protein LOC113789811 [Dermatophagoides pteronyssinus]KAH9425815.1 hypothetical protein DERP_005033 [Dermatophagoides pteronyssinus]